jgi:hypothetical protein
MESIIKLLKWFYENWASIATIICLCIGLYFKVKDIVDKYLAMNEAEKAAAAEEAVEAAKRTLKETILLYVNKAENDWAEEAGKMGKTKKAQVISEIFKDFPELAGTETNNEILWFIDNLIDKALEEMNKEYAAYEEDAEEEIEEEVE